jgi:DNA-binding transcriptional ArsR family regulator
MNAKLVDIDDPRLVKALAHPIRMKILNILDERMATPKELAEVLGLPLENVSYHVRTLKDFGFIKLEKTRQVRGAVEHHYKIAARPRIGDKLWGATPRIVQEAMTDASLDAFVHLLGQAAAQGGFDFGESHISRHSLELDDEGVKELGLMFTEMLDRMETVAEKSRKRAREGETRRISAAVMLFETPKSLPPEEAAKERDARRRRREQKSTA